MKWLLSLAVPVLALVSIVQPQDAIEVGDRFHITGCENGVPVLSVVNIWSQPIGSAGPVRIVGELSGEGRADGPGVCQGAVVIAHEIRSIEGRTHIKIESVVNRTVGWITDSFVGKKFDTATCAAYFDERGQVFRCTGAVAPTPVRRACCRICRTGKACGNSCISRSYTCRQPRGCACNGDDGVKQWPDGPSSKIWRLQ